MPCLDPGQSRENPRLAGGWTRFSAIEVLERGRAPHVVPVTDLADDTLASLVTSRPSIADLSFDAPRLMGILNVTPDSFSDGGVHIARNAAIARAFEMAKEGADLLDVGGESTRPGADAIAVRDEIDRIVPVISGLRDAGFSHPISVDTRKACVGQAGLRAGADLLNDVSGLRFDPDLADVAARSGAPLILMHSIGTPETMQGLAANAYADVLLDAYDALDAAVTQAEAAGVSRRQIMVDPGIGFGKTLDQNIALLKRVSLFHGLGCPILVGVSRKGMIGTLSGERHAAKRGPGSAALGLWAVSQGIQMLRVHDIGVHKQALALWQAMATHTE